MRNSASSGAISREPATSSIVKLSTSVSSVANHIIGSSSAAGSEGVEAKTSVGRVPTSSAMVAGKALLEPTVVTIAVAPDVVGVVGTDVSCGALLGTDDAG